ncbi:MAG: hypothetical protein EOM24_25735, partial [Chloroflexia bacterium]|nr:hypothetical protein [Chloroflexia bacterium]
MQRQRQRLRVIDGLLALYPVGLIGLTLLALVAPQRTGPMALSQVFAHFLFLPLLLLLPLAVLVRLSLLRFALGAALA